MAIRLAIRQRLEYERTLYQFHSKLSEDDWLTLMLRANPGPHTTMPVTDIDHPGTIRVGKDQVIAALQDQSCKFSAEWYGSKFEAHAAAILWCLRAAK